MTRDEVDALLVKRKKARSQGNFHVADALRNQLAANGVTVLDTFAGQIASHGTEAELRVAQSALGAAQARIAALEKSLETMQERERSGSERLTMMVWRLCRANALLHEARIFCCGPDDLIRRLDAALDPNNTDGNPIDAMKARGEG